MCIYLVCMVGMSIMGLEEGCWRGSGRMLELRLGEKAVCTLWDIEAGEEWKACLFWGRGRQWQQGTIVVSTPSGHILVSRNQLVSRNWKKLWRAGWFQNSGRESTRWTWNIIFCQKVRRCLKNDRIRQKNTDTGLKGLLLTGILWALKKKCADYNPVTKTRIFESTLMQTYPYIHNLKAYWGMGCWQSQRIFLWKTYKLQRKN